jgi:murein DD-endopeptidase MepM/ murein hydrolase activator NlpD
MIGIGLSPILRVRSRLLAVLAAVVTVAAVLVSASAARPRVEASARAAVVRGTLGELATVRADGDADTSRSAPSQTPKGIGLGSGSASASASRGGGDASATASAEARDVDLLDGLVTADLVRRGATDAGGDAAYHGTVRGLAIGDQEIGDVGAGKRYDLPNGEGFVVVNRGSAGLILTLTQAYNGYPAGTGVSVADVEARARDGAVQTATPSPRATATASPSVTATATPSTRARPRRSPAYERRLMWPTFVLPVRGQARIGGPFRAFRAAGPHEGNDLFADFGTPVVAVADGTVENVGSLKISGNRLWVYADTGDQFFYAHLSAFSPEAIDGRHVSAGTVLGSVGNTGDAEPTPPHLHFEIHPDGGKAVDPNPFLVAWQKRAGDASTDNAQRPGALVEVRDFIGGG